MEAGIVIMMPAKITPNVLSMCPNKTDNGM